MKLDRQLADHGITTEGMPPLEVMRGSDGDLVIFDGVTRATRVAKYLPGTEITLRLLVECLTVSAICLLWETGYESV